VAYAYKGWCTGFTAVVATLLSSVATAGGFQVFNQSASGLGTATAHQAAIEDASTAYWNPAGMVYLRRTEGSVGLDLIRPSTRFRNHGSTTFLPAPNGTALSGGNGGDGGALAPAPLLHFVRPMNQRVWLGFSLTFPFGVLPARLHETRLGS
jgi:long-chain fatty acid transport protein